MEKFKSDRGLIHSAVGFLLATAYFIYSGVHQLELHLAYN